MAIVANSRAGSGLLVLWRNRVLVEARGRAPHLVAPEGFERPQQPIALEGEAGGPAGFVQLDASQDGLAQLSDDAAAPLRFIDPMFELGRAEGAVRRALVRALAVARWSEATRFCAQCGLELAWDEPGRIKICANAEPHRHWPRLDPSAIMLVSDGERMLLGRQPTWPAGMYSTLAGFVEPGETVEETVAREVFEESGIRVGRVTYFGSEPWPFPRSLMLGFFAEATSHEIVRGDELEDVRWFTCDEGLDLQRTLSERTPHADTIARRLIATWLRQKGNVSAFSP
jgi:NAD+ diphosphatase